MVNFKHISQCWPGADLFLQYRDQILAVADNIERIAC